MRTFLRMTAVLMAALVINIGLYLLVPYIQVLIQRKALASHKVSKNVTTVIAVAPPEEEKAKRKVIKEIKTEAYRPPTMATARPTTPGGGLKIDLSPAGGEGQGLLSGGDRTGGIGPGSGGEKGAGLAAMTYEQGQTDIDAKMVKDGELNYPSRAEREGISGYVDVTFIVTEGGMVEQVTVLKEDPGGYGFAASAIDALKQMRFKPAILEKMSVRQRFKRRFTWDAQR